MVDRARRWLFQGIPSGRKLAAGYGKSKRIAFTNQNAYLEPLNGLWRHDALNQYDWRFSRSGLLAKLGTASTK